jgi:hypothetical protein
MIHLIGQTTFFAVSAGQIGHPDVLNLLFDDVLGETKILSKFRYALGNQLFFDDLLSLEYSRIVSK